MADNMSSSDNQELKLAEKELCTTENEPLKERKIANFLMRLDVSSGLNITKVIFWLGMALTIIFLSPDIVSEIISAITYFLGIIFDMLLLRKNLSKDGTSLIRLASGFLILLFMGVEIALVLCLAASALGKTLWPWVKTIIDFAMLILGFFSTIVEVINSVGKDD